MARRRDELGRVAADGAGELDRHAVVMRRHLRAVLGPVGRQRREPFGGAAVTFRARRARDLRVGDVLHERVRERVLLLTCKGTAPLATDELLALERVEELT